MLYLYAITDRPEVPVPDDPSLEGACPLGVAYREIVAVVSPISRGEVPATEAHLWQHEGVIEALMADRAVLPLRFGTVLAGQAAVQDLLAARYADFVAALERVRGRVELGVRVLWEPGSRDAEVQRCEGAAEEGDGRAYLMARLEEERQRQVHQRQAEALAAELHASLGRLAVESTQKVLLTPRLLLTAAYLVECDQMESFQQAVDNLSSTYPALRFLCTGPWPPYNFVTGDVRS